MSEILILTGEVLEKLLRSIEASDYCPLCDCHPSYGHAGNCPLGDFAPET